MNPFVVLAATWFGTGFSPVASGTVGTVGAIPLYLLLTRLPLLPYLAVTALFTLAACWISGAAERMFQEQDSGKIVIDEVAGFLVTMTGVTATWQTVLAGFLLFRFFDIVKPPPARYFDRRMKNGYGVVLDDVAAGVYACLTLHLAARFM
jgi:phosphatidylglycerophosphatase A